MSKKIYAAIPVKEKAWKKKVGKGRRDYMAEQEARNTWGPIILKRELREGRPPKVRKEWRKERLRKIMKNEIIIKLDDGDKVALTDFQHAFVLSYVKDGNATKAAKAAGSTAEGSSLRSVGYKTLNIPGVKQAIRQIEKEVLIDSAVSCDEVIMNMKRIIQEARMAKKFDAAYKANEKLGEYMNMWGKGTEGNGSSGARTIDAFASSNDDMDISSDVSKFLGMSKGEVTPTDDEE